MFGTEAGRSRVKLNRAGRVRQEVRQRYGVVHPDLHVISLTFTLSVVLLHPQKSLSASDYFLEKDPATGICNFFYDSAPSGSYGTMTYLSKAAVTYVQDFLPSSSCMMQ